MTVVFVLVWKKKTHNSSKVLSYKRPQRYNSYTFIVFIVNLGR